MHLLLTRLFFLLSLFFIYWGLNNFILTEKIFLFSLSASYFSYILIDGMEILPRKMLIKLRVIRYVLWLMKEILLSSKCVMLYIWQNKKYDIASKTFEYSKQDLTKVLYANSITLTPGTVTADIIGDHITVYALDKKMLDGLELEDFAMRKNIEESVKYE